MISYFSLTIPKRVLGLIKLFKNLSQMYNVPKWHQTPYDFVVDAYLNTKIEFFFFKFII